MRRAEAIYSIHGRTNANLRLDVQTILSILGFHPASSTCVGAPSSSLRPCHHSLHPVPFLFLFPV